MCSRCGRCCNVNVFHAVHESHLPETRLIWLTNDEIEAIGNAGHKDKIIGRSVRFSESGDCPFLIMGRCEINDIKPGPCRNYPEKSIYKTCINERKLNGLNQN